MDLYAEPPGTEFEQANNFSAHVGGSAANIAVALAKLGLQVLPEATASMNSPVIWPRLRKVSLYILV